VAFVSAGEAASLCGFLVSTLRIATERAPDVPFVFVSGTIGEERAINALRRFET